MKRRDLKGFLDKEISIAIPHKVYGNERPFFYRDILKAVNDDSIVFEYRNKMMLLQLDWILQVVEE